MSALHLSIDGAVAELRLDNPAKLNALTVPMLDALEAHLDAAIALNPNFMVQRKGGAPGAGALDVHRVAAAGTRGPAGALPHLGAIQRSFGPDHDLSAVQAYVGGPDAEAARGAIDFEAVSFRYPSRPDTAALVVGHMPLQRLEPPVQLPGFDITMTWHRRYHDDPASQWLRETLLALFKAGVDPHPLSAAP